MFTDESKTSHSTKVFGRSTSRSESDDGNDIIADGAPQVPGSRPMHRSRTCNIEAQPSRELTRKRRHTERPDEVLSSGVELSAAGVLFASMDYRPGIKPKEPSVDVEMLQKEVRELEQQQIQLRKDHKQLESVIKQEFQELKEFLSQRITVANTLPECRHCDVLKELKKCVSLRSCLHVLSVEGYAYFIELTLVSIQWHRFIFC